jgi:6-pyruvoyl-tetrahydropterin synthase
MKISLFYDHVTVLDYAYLDEHLGPLGHSKVVDVEFIGETDHEGIVFDFSLAKKKVKDIIDRDCDHRFVVPQNILKQDEKRSYFTYNFGYDDSKFEYWSPEEGICEIPFDQVSDQTLLTYLEMQVMKEMPQTVKSVKLRLREEKGTEQESFFQYTHGLKDHYGNCQRLIHGHKSTVKVFVNGKRDPEEESYLANELFSSSIHFCFWENVVNKNDFIRDVNDVPVGRVNSAEDVHIKYESSQGEFEAILPGRIVYIMDAETTVENLSIHFSDVVKKRYPSKSVQVYAFEGIAKGAISTRV